MADNPKWVESLTITRPRRRESWLWTNILKEDFVGKLWFAFITVLRRYLEKGRENIMNEALRTWTAWARTKS